MASGGRDKEGWQDDWQVSRYEEVTDLQYTCC